MKIYLSILLIITSYFFCYTTTTERNYKDILSLKEKFFPNPNYYCQPQFNSIEANPYELHTLITLEMREQIKKIIQGDPLFAKCDRLIILAISTLLSEAHSLDKAVKQWHAIPQIIGRELHEFTDSQQYIINLPCDMINHFYSLAQISKEQITSSILENIQQRNATSHHYHDQHQRDQTPTRDINTLQAKNITMSLANNTYRAIIEEAYRKNSNCPLLEQLKNIQIFTIGDFDNSKGGFIVHDIYDHLWFSIKLHNAGIFSKYTAMLQQIGNPHITDIFSREGELIATIAAHFRWFHFSEYNYRPLFEMRDILTILEHSREVGTFTRNQQNAYALLSSIKPDTKYYKALPFILSGMSIQMLKYITLNGFPKLLNEYYQPYSYFDVFDPEHIAFVTEAAYILFANYEQSINILLAITLWIENYLVGVAQGIETDNLTIELAEIENISDYITRFNRLDRSKINWIKNYIGFEVVRYPVGRR